MFQPLHALGLVFRRRGALGRPMALLGGALALALGAALAAPNATTSMLQARIAELEIVPFSFGVVAPVEPAIRDPRFHPAAPASGALGVDVDRARSF